MIHKRHKPARHSPVRSTMAGRVRSVLCLSFCWLVLSGFGGGPLHIKNEEGNAFYEQKQYDKAEQAYVSATSEDPESPELHYNIGNVLYNQQKYDKAIEEYNKALSSEEQNQRSQIFYNMGNALFKNVNLQNLKSQEELDQAMETYRQAINSYTETLIIHSHDRDAKYNIEYIRRMLKELAQKSQDQQQQQQSQQSQGQEEQQSKEEQQQGQKEQEDEEEQEKQQQQAAQKQEQEQSEEEQEQQQQMEEEKTEMTPEEANRILDSLKEEEEKLEQLIQIPEGAYGGNDW